MTKRSPKLIPITAVSEARGTLIAAEALAQVPFAISRFFVVTGVPQGERRGEHAHHRCEQFLVCLQGSVDAVAETSETRDVFQLDTPTQGLYIPPMTWGGQFNHSPDAILLVLASEPFDVEDYIHDYDIFRSLGVVDEASRK